MVDTVGLRNQDAQRLGRGHSRTSGCQETLPRPFYFTYYLGSYNCAGGDVQTARALVTEAIQLNKSLQKVAIEDKDLAALLD